MTKSPDRTTLSLELPNEIVSTLKARAGDMDLSITTYLSGLLADSFQTGCAERHVIRSLSAKRVTPRRALKTNAIDQEWRWEMIVPRALWSNDPWDLERRGMGGRHQKPGDGWYLSGPGLVEPVFMGTEIKQAKLDAAPYIRGWLARESA